jgi:predicted secreted protein
MAIFTGNDGKVRVGATDLAAVRSFSIEQTRDTIETSSMGTDVRTYVAGLSTFSGSADIYFDDAELSNLTGTLNVASSGNTVGAGGAAVKLVLKDESSNDKWFSGDIIITGLTVNSNFDGMVEASISFQGTGPITWNTTGSYSA